ncbi:hypothetical protein M9Y10_037232 [Tritrichomonas musculus]|uniref:DUF3447 domain-containing protein n=1 Tax=Tritrichomonas musculus TaxID=1915356 RepID=A0ABR2GST5_9EUKA
MNSKEHLEVLQTIQASILTYIDNEDDIEEYYGNIIRKFDELNICDNFNLMKLILRLISCISIYHHRFKDFFLKIEKILLYFKSAMKKNFTNAEIFYIFKYSNRILLFLIREKMLFIEKSIMKYFYYQEYFLLEHSEIKFNQNEEEVKKDYRKNYLSDEIEELLYSDVESSDSLNFDESNFVEYEEEEDKSESIEKTEKNGDNKRDAATSVIIDEFKDKIKSNPDYEKKRNNGENESEICDLIRKDLIGEFITYINQNNIQINSTISESFYETHYMLSSHFEVTLIEYAAFFGSIQIFKYLYLNGAKLNRKTIWIYAINGANPEIINFLEERNIKPIDEEYAIQCYEEAVKCHNNEFARYIENKYLTEQMKKRSDVKSFGFKYYNFEVFPNNFNDFSYFLISFDYYILFECLLKENKININQKIKIPIGILQLKTLLIYGFTRYSDEVDEKTPLIIAIELERIDFIKLLLSQPNIDVNARKISNYYNYSCLPAKNTKLEYDFVNEKSPLHVAYEINNMEIIKILLSFPNIDVNNKYIKKKVKGEVVNDQIEKNNNFYKVLVIEDESLLSIAISDNNIEFIKMLLENPYIDVNIEETKYIDDNRCMIKYRPFIKALEMKNIEIIQLLLSNSKVDINCKFVRTIQGDLITEKNPLLMSMYLFEDDQIFNLLLSNPKIEVNALVARRTKKNDILSKRTVLYEAVEKNDFEKVTSLLSHPNIDVNFKAINVIEMYGFLSEKSPLFLAVKNQNIKMVSLLLAQPKIDVNFESIKSINNDLIFAKKSILYEAVLKGNIDIIQLLLENSNIDVNYQSSVKCKYKDGIKKSSKTILFLAVSKGRLDIVQLLLKNKNIDVNETSSASISFDQNPDYITCKAPLHEAVLKGSIEIIKLLLSNEKIDPNIKDESKKKPIELTEDEEIRSLFRKP